MTRAEYKAQLQAVIRQTFKHGSGESVWIAAVAGAMAALSPEQWDDITDEMIWEMRERDMLPPDLAWPSRTRKQT